MFGFGVWLGLLRLFLRFWLSFGFNLAPKPAPFLVDEKRRLGGRNKVRPPSQVGRQEEVGGKKPDVPIHSAIILAFSLLWCRERLAEA